MTFARNAMSVGTATLVSRILGFVRDVMVAAALGAGPVADAFVVAFRLPSLLRRLLAEGAINSAFVPLHAEAGSPQDGQRLADEVFTLLGAGLAAVTVLGLALMPGLVGLVAPGFEAEVPSPSRSSLPESPSPIASPRGCSPSPRRFSTCTAGSPPRPMRRR